MVSPSAGAVVVIPSLNPHNTIGDTTWVKNAGLFLFQWMKLV